MESYVFNLASFLHYSFDIPYSCDPAEDMHKTKAINGTSWLNIAFARGRESMELLKKFHIQNFYIWKQGSSTQIAIKIFQLISISDW